MPGTFAQQFLQKNFKTLSSCPSTLHLPVLFLERSLLTTGLTPICPILSVPNLLDTFTTIPATTGSHTAQDLHRGAHGNCMFLRTHLNTLIQTQKKGNAYILPCCATPATRKEKNIENNCSTVSHFAQNDTKCIKRVSEIVGTVTTLCRLL